MLVSAEPVGLTGGFAASEGGALTFSMAAVRWVGSSGRFAASERGALTLSLTVEVVTSAGRFAASGGGASTLHCPLPFRDSSSRRVALSLVSRWEIFFSYSSFEAIGRPAACPGAGALAFLYALNSVETRLSLSPRPLA